MIIKSKTNLSIALILILATFAIINNLWSYNSLDSIPLLSSSDLMDSNKGKTYHFVGTVYSIKHTDKLDFITLANNEITTINSTIWPSIGLYDIPNKNDSIRITGILNKYKNKWQINPLSAEHIHVIMSNANLSNKGSCAKYGCIEYESINACQCNDLCVDYGNCCDDYEEICSGESEVVSSEICDDGMDNDNDGYVDCDDFNCNGMIGDFHTTCSVSLADAIDRIGETLIIGPVYPENPNVITSNNGKLHLQFKVKEDDLTINGIMWEGIWDDKTLKIFNDAIPIFIKSEVRTYNNNISLITKRVIK